MVPALGHQQQIKALQESEAANQSSCLCKCCGSRVYRLEKTQIHELAGTHAVGAVTNHRYSVKTDGNKLLTAAGMSAAYWSAGARTVQD